MMGSLGNGGMGWNGYMGEFCSYCCFVIDANLLKVFQEWMKICFLSVGTMEVQIEGMGANGELGDVVGCDHGVYENQDLRGNLR